MTRIPSNLPPTGPSKVTNPLELNEPPVNCVEKIGYSIHASGQGTFVWEEDVLLKYGVTNSTNLSSSKFREKFRETVGRQKEHVAFGSVNGKGSFLFTGAHGFLLKTLDSLLEKFHSKENDPFSCNYVFRRS